MTEIEWRNIFAIKLQNLMYERGMTETSLAVQSGLGQPAIWRYLHAERVPLTTSALNIAKALNVSLDELFDYGEMIGFYEMEGENFYDDFRAKEKESGTMDFGF